MLWSILLVKKNDNGWFINYIQDKLNSQISKLNLHKDIEVVIYEHGSKFYGDYVNIIEDNVDISDNYIKVIYNKLSVTDKDCIGLKGLVFINNNPYIFSNIDNIDNELYFPISKLNPIKKEIIFKLGSILHYINSVNLSNIIKTIDNIDNIVIFKNDDKLLTKESVSIIVTAYKTQDYIEECLDSIEKQTYFINNENYEILVGVDGCQETLNKINEINHKYRNLKIFMMSENKGTYITSNTLINLAQYENVIRFDSDDIMTPGLVNEIIKNKKDYDIVIFGSVQLLNGKIDHNKFLLTEGSIYFKKSVMDNIAGGYQPWLCAADTELIKRLSNKIKIHQLKKALFYRRIHSNSLTNNRTTGHFTDIRNNYKKQIKNHYNDNEIKIERIINNFKIKEYNYQTLNVNNYIFKKIGILIVNYNNLKYTINCVNDIFNQINKNFELWIVDQNSSEIGTNDFLNQMKLKGVNVIKNDSNVYLNYVWNYFYDICKLDYLCFLNNDIRLTNNFTDDIINIFDKEPNIGIVIHVTNNLDFVETKHELNYEVLSPPLNQGWDYTIKRELYNRIPGTLNIFGGEDFLFSSIVKNSYKVALAYSSPVIHYKEKTRIILGESIKHIHKSDIINFHIEKEKNNYEIIPPTYTTTKCNKYAPKGIKLKQNKKCIFIASIGDYDNLTTSNLNEKQKDWDYICFTDNKNMKSDFWKIVYISKDNNSILFNHKLARYFKTNFFNYLSSYDIILWKDVRKIINCNLNDYLKNLKDTDDMLFMKHPDANSIYEEFDRVLELNLESKDVIEKIKERYKNDNYYYDNGLFETAIILFRNNERTIDFFKTWWNEINNFSHRDQLSANYAIYKNPNLMYSTIPHSEVVSPKGYFLRGVRKSQRYKKF